MHDIHIDPSWKTVLQPEFSQPYWASLTDRIRKDYQSTTVYPEPSNIFRAFNLCPFDKVKVVIVGQDPYHGPNQAIGLSFAVKDGIKLPPSLKNIYKEIENDLGITPLPTGVLSRWAEQGVLLLNNVLTVLAGQPTSHTGLGWEQFTNAAIRALNQERQHLVYMLWGKHAQKKGQSIDREHNLILESAHPSPLAGGAFFGHHHFSRCNDYLQQHHHTPIDWR